MGNEICFYLIRIFRICKKFVSIKSYTGIEFFMNIKFMTFYNDVQIMYLSSDVQVLQYFKL